MSKLTAAYIAGFIDGEGCFQIVRQRNAKRYKYLECNLTIANTNKEIIYWLKDSFGGYVGTRKFENNSRDAYYWSLRLTKNIKPFLEKIIPYLKVKKKHAEIMREFLKTFEKENYSIVSSFKERENIGKAQRRLNGNIFQKREDLMRKMKSLNQRGKNSLHAERLNEQTPLNGDAIV